MKVNDEVFEEMVKSIKKSLPSFHSHYRSVRKYIRRFLNVYSDNDREFIIKEILHNQNKSIIKAIQERKNIAIPFIGTFQYRETLEAIKEITKEVKEKYGIIDLRKCDPVLAEIAINEINEKKKEVIIPLYFSQIGGKGSTVKTDFLKKDE